MPIVHKLSHQRDIKIDFRKIPGADHFFADNPHVATIRIDIEELCAAENKADVRASWALCFSRILAVQCWRALLGFGVR